MEEKLNLNRDLCDICGKELGLTAYSDDFENIVCCSKEEHDLYFSDHGTEEGLLWIKDFPGYPLKRESLTYPGDRWEPVNE